MKKLFEVRFITREGRVLRGPIFSSKDEYKSMKDLIDGIKDMTVLRFRLGSHRIVIPQQVIETGYAEIKRIGWIRGLIRIWRCRG
jgi:hypothetical protein